MHTLGNAQLAACLAELGRYLDADGFHHRALPHLVEAIALLRQQPDPTDKKWASAMVDAGGHC